MCMLVCYHDLIGDVIGKGRDRSQIVDVVRSPEDFDMLAALSLADVTSLIPESQFAAMLSPHRTWLARMKAELPELRKWVLEHLKKKES